MRANNLIGPSDIFASAAGEPIVSSLLDTDFYKLSMGQLINSRRRWADATVTFSLNVRSPDVHLADVIDIGELREQLDHARTLRFTPAELAYLAGIPLDGKRMFGREYIDFLTDYTLPEYSLRQLKGDFLLSFKGSWSEVTYWETIALPIISELYYWSLVRKHRITPSEFTLMYGSLFSRVMDGVRTLRQEPDLTFSDFGTRRRHSGRFQRLVLDSYADMLPDQYVGTSNVLLAMLQGSNNPIGTNAHELPMVAANLTDETDSAIRASQYGVVNAWSEMYPQLSIILPDTFGTTQFLAGAPAKMAREYMGVRLDSKDPDEATDEVIAWWESHGVDPKTKVLIPSDGLTHQKMIDLFARHARRVGRYTFGIGTNATNNIRGIWPRVLDPGFSQFSMVIKVTEAGGRPTVKLADNPGKAMGGKRADRFRKIFGTVGAKEQPILV